MGASPQTPEVFRHIGSSNVCQQKGVNSNVDPSHSFQCAGKAIPRGSLLSVAPCALPCDRKITKIVTIDKRERV